MNASVLALHQILDWIEDLRGWLGSADVAALDDDRMRRAAVERAVEIISEASRRIPDSWKAAEAEVPWQKIAGIGNVLRDDYDDVVPLVLTDLRDSGHLDRLEGAIRRMVERHDPEGVRFLRTRG